MSAPYSKSTSKVRATRTPQSMPIPGREAEMTQNLAGGFSFKADDWQALRRWLLVGSMSGAYYQNAQEMTDGNKKLLMKLIGSDPARVGQEILDASKKGISVHTPIYALTYLSMGDMKAKNVFKEVFANVVRNGSHLYEFFNYTKNERGLGSLIHKTVENWISGKDAKELEYQFLKYQSRYDWSAKDILRTIRPTPKNDLQKAVFNWVIGGTKKNPLMESFPVELARINAYEQLKKGASENDVVDAIKQYKMTWEMMPGNLKMTDKIWEALFLQMPVGATIRNLGNLTDKNAFQNHANLDILEARFSKEALGKAYIHPVVFASALKVYEMGGEGGKSKLRWSPIARVKDIMEDGIEKCFDVLEPTGLDFFYALDVSSSMTSGNVGNLHMTPMEVEGVMALASVRSEKNYFVGGFNTSFSEIPNFTKKMTYRDSMHFWHGSFGGTDANSAYVHATRNNIKTDVFVFFTDNESWAGYQHPSEGLKAYRNKLNKNAKAVYVTLIPYSDRVSLVDPTDKNSYDIAGFSPDCPKMIQLMARGEL